VARSSGTRGATPPNPSNPTNDAQDEPRTPRTADDGREAPELRRAPTAGLGGRREMPTRLRERLHRELQSSRHDSRWRRLTAATVFALLRQPWAMERSRSCSSPTVVWTRGKADRRMCHGGAAIRGCPGCLAHQPPAPPRRAGPSQPAASNETAATAGKVGPRRPPRMLNWLGSSLAHRPFTVAAPVRGAGSSRRSRSAGVVATGRRRRAGRARPATQLPAPRPTSLTRVVRQAAWRSARPFPRVRGKAERLARQAPSPEPEPSLQVRYAQRAPLSDCRFCSRSGSNRLATEPGSWTRMGRCTGAIAGCTAFGCRPPLPAAADGDALDGERHAAIRATGDPRSCAGHHRAHNSAYHWSAAWS